MAMASRLAQVRWLSTSVGKVVRLVPDGALVKLRDGSDDKLRVPHPQKPAKRLMIHDDVVLSKAADGSWLATVFDDPSSSSGIPRSRAGRSHLDDMMGGKSTGLLSDLHGWRKKK